MRAQEEQEDIPLIKKYTHAVCLTLAIFMIMAGWLAAPPKIVQADDDVSWLLTQINALRAAHGVRPLALNAQLMASSTAHSQYLASNPWSDPHIEANGSTPHSRMAAAGYPGAYTGENVYGGGMATAAIAFTWWVGSPVHFQGMVNNGFSEVGIGIASGPYGHYFTTDFGDRSGGIVPPPDAPNVANPTSTVNGDAANVLNLQAPPKPTRRPATAVPTNTPAPTLTPSDTFTPLPTHTMTPTETPEPPTTTAIVIVLSPQMSLELSTQSLAQSSAIPTAALPSSTPIAVALLSTNVPATSVPAASVVSVAVTETPMQTRPVTDNPVRTLLPFAIGLPVLMLGGFVLWNRRH